MLYTECMELRTWAKEQGISYQAARRMYRDGKLPVPVEQLPTGMIIKTAMPLGQRVFPCEVCGAEIDRDRNAARNLASLVAGSSLETLNACGAEGSGQENGLVKPAVAKQERSNRKPAVAGNKRL